MKGLISALIAAFVVWLGLVIWVPSARQGRVFAMIPGTLGDFFCPRVSAELEVPYRGMPDQAAFSALKAERGWCDRRMWPIARHVGKVEDWPDGFPARLNSVDCCYPALALALVKPFAVSCGGALSAVALGTLLLMFGVVLCARRIGLSPGWSCASGLMVLAAAPALRAMGRGQLVLFAAAGLAVFLAWYDSERPGRRFVAALALAVAVALKLTPAVFAVLYLRPNAGVRGLFNRDLLLFGFLAMLLLFVPFFWFGGVDGFQMWLSNAAENGRAYAAYANWGIVRLYRVWLAVKGIHPTVQPLRPWFRCIEIAIGAAAFVLGWRRRDVVLLVASILLVPGNMMDYTGVYLLPVMMISRPNRFECLLWFVILCPLQWLYMRFSVNTVWVLFAFWTVIAVRAKLAISPH